MKKEIVMGILLALLLASIATLAFSIRPVKAEILEPPVTEWSKTYGGTQYDVANSVIQTSDGGYALVGYTYSFGAGSYDFWLIKTDAAGNMQWNRTYGGAGSDLATCFTQTSDEGYALAGWTDSFGAGGWDFWMVKTGEDGNMQWNKTYGGSGDDYPYSVVQTSDGGYALAGWTDSFGAGSYDFWLIKVDTSGNMQWNETYGGTGADAAYSMIKTGDGGYALVGNTDSFGAGGSDLWMVKVNASGDMEWNKTYGGANHEVAWSMIQTSDGGYALSGSTLSFGAGDRDCWLVKTDLAGNMLWNKTYGGPYEDTANSFIQTSDGGYALAGGTLSFGAGDQDFWMVKTNSTGSQQWDITYGGTSTDVAHSVIQTADGGYALTGYTWSFGTGGGDFWLIKAIESNPPDICVPSQNPPRDNVQPYQNVTVSVNVTDAESGVKNATLYYSLTNGTTWEAPVPMSLNVTTSLYEATIPGQPIGTWVRFKIVAYDIAGNNATRDGTALDFIYQVVPEFPTTAILPLLMVLTMLAVVFAKRKIPRKLET